MDLHRLLRSLSLLIFILATYLSNSEARQHRHNHGRQRDKRFGEPAYYVLDGGSGPDRGPWGPWTEEGPCSRTCGGGVTYQNRSCTGVFCEGPSRRYFSCNIQDCPERSHDFRAEQCAAFDPELFDGVYYDWIPYTKAPNKCELNCMPKGERFYYRQRDKVIDGTRCEEEKLDVCVEGKCLPVGCDMMLGSPVREDKCRECGGDNTGCTTASGILENEDLQVGYNDILLIPAGATNIRIREVKASNNYLAIRNVTGHYYLNGNWRIDFPRSLRFAGSVFHYERKPHAFFAPETISCLGPTTEALYIVLLYQEHNPGVEYEYSIPKGLVQETDPDSYVWVSGDFGPCSATCGGGTQQRKVWCAKRKDLSEVSTDLCDSALILSTEGTCANEPCSPQWALGEWAPCSQTCGPGSVKIRQVICEQIVSYGRPSLVDSSACEELLGPSPPTKEECDDIPCPKWHIGPWLPCDKLCGEGKQKRKVRCFTKTDGRIEVLGDSACPTDKPQTEMSCQLKPCEGLDWIVSEWSGCDEKCGLSFETREAHCATQKGQVYPDSFCHKYRVPPLIRECENPPTCQHEWFASQWSECSVKCGTGVQTRKVFCGTFEDETLKKVDDSKCDIEQKYEDTKNCTGKEVCKGHWFTGPWSTCSKPCGGGTMSRKVLCLLENKTVDATNCDPHLVAFSSEACNNHACGEDEIVPVEPTHPITEEEEDVCEDDDYDDGDDGSALLARLVVDDTSKKFDLVESISFSSTSDTGETSSFETSSSDLSKGTDTSSSILSTGSIDYSGSPSDMMMSDFTYSPTDTDTSVPSSSVGSTEESLSSTTEESETGSTDLTEQSSPSSESSTLISSDAQKTTESSIFELISSTVSLGLSSLSSSLASSSTDSSTDISSTEISSTDYSYSSSGTSDVSPTDLSSSGETVTISSSLETSDTTETDITSSSLSTDSTVTDSTETSSQSSSSSTDKSSTFQLQTVSTSESSSVSSESTSESSASSVGISSLSSEILSSTAETTTEIESSSATSESTTSESTTLFSSSESTSSSENLSTTEESTDESSTSFDSSSSTEELSSSSSPSPSPSSVETTETLSSSSQYASSTSESSSSSSPTDESSLSSLSTTTSYTDTATTVSYATDIWSTSQSTVEVAVTKEQKPRKCKRKKKKPKSKEPKCITSEFGCCSDNVTEAQGPFNKGCPQPTTCKETKFGCCSDGVSPALGKDDEGCPSLHCNETLFGCCPDGLSIAEGNDDEGCPVEEVTLPFDCKKTQFGCCPDGIAPASGQNFAGCFECEGSGECDTCTDTKYGCCPDGFSAAAGPDNAGCETVTTDGFITVSTETETGEDCVNSTYGCCPDGLTPAAGEDEEGCPGTEAPVDKSCGKSQFGCCPDGNTTATGPNNAGCPSVCPDSPYGCCDDNETPAHGPNKEGCCLNTAYGCCPDNIKAALGPNLEGCGCHYSTYGCCPDNSTAARGPNNEGCGCQYTAHGCCPNKYTPAAGPNFQGCPCHTHQFGCCPDGITRAKGPHLEGCGCENTEFGCCADGHTPASGPDRNCTCEASLFGCCPDGETEAAGEHFEGCAEIPFTAGEQCTQPKDRGPCRDFTVKWFFDTEYGGCARFWYGGCGGNENRFRSQEECASTCVELQGKEACTLPKIEGPCEGYYPTWYYNTERNQCAQFIYGGCLGNSNNFETREACHELCIKPSTLDACEQSVEKGVCKGNFTRWYHDKESKSCQEFTYGGCKPNGNNFLTELACQQKCLHPGRSRVADICTLPVEPGPCPGSVMRWHFDTELESCKPFVYGGCQGNANRFRSESECQRYCLGGTDLKPDECSLPRAQGSCSERLPRWFFDASENRCMPFYYSGCEGNGNSFETQELCETACPPKVEQDTCSLPVVPGECHNYTEQWYYDVYLERCRRFYYGGCGGNQNRFNTEVDCQRRCDRNYISSPSVTPVNFTTDMCFLPVDKGPCSQSEALWYYDAGNGVCAQFIYGGCEGNANRFESRPECEQRCGEAQDICNLPRVVGPCSGNYQQWYYDSSTDSCQVFDYGGCQGNSNRFNTITECEGKCRKSYPPPQEVLSTAGPPAPPSKSSICYTPVESGPCRAQIPAWYFNADTGRCQLFIYGGCQGNANRFDSEEQCDRHCGEFQGLDVCRFQVDVGPCLQNLRKWYFDADSETCQEFNYGGCSGSPNRFSSLEECNSVCLHREEIFPNDNTTAISHIAVCKLPVDAGPCQDGYYKRWFFNEAHQTCEQFDYGGCAGNLNRFKSFQICIEFCASLSGSNEIDDRKEECAGIELACSRTLHCEFGIERWVDEKGCENCRCHNPCITSDSHCPPNTTCSVEMQKNEETGDIEYHAVCRPVSKDGECPQIFRTKTECSDECKGDADCPGDAKCCYNGCGLSCIRPQAPVTSAPTTQGPPPDSFNVPGASPPQIEETEPQTEGEEGDMVTLRCIAHGTPTPVITWYKGDQKLGFTGGRYRFLSDGTVQIIGLYRSDAGVYVCIANNTSGPPVRREFIVIVKDPTSRPAAVIGDPNSDIVVSLGSQAVLQCFTIGWPRPAVTWWRGSRMLPLNSEQYEQRRDHSLVLHSVTLTGLGFYTCQAYNGLGSAASWTVTLKAIGPVYSSDPNDVTYNQFLVPLPRIPPAVDSPVHPLPPPYRPYYPIQVPQPSPETHPPPTEPPTPEAPRVFVVPVKTNISLEETTFPVSSDISIPCDVDGYPVPHVTWFKDESPLEINERVHITESSRLLIVQANTNDTGIYRCHAENAYSSADSSISINVQGVYIHPNCTDNPFFANCNLIVKAHYCTHTYYARFCCKSCTQAGQLPPLGPHLGSGSSNAFSSPNNLFRRRRSLVNSRL